MAETSTTTGKNPKRVAAGLAAAAKRAAGGQNIATMPSTGSGGGTVASGGQMGAAHFPWLKNFPAAHRESALIAYGVSLGEQQSARNLTTASIGTKQRRTRKAKRSRAAAQTT